jgi:hypothetical protein
MRVKAIFFAAALGAAVTCQVPARGADSSGAELECNGKTQPTLHALAHIDFAPTKRIVLRLDSPAGNLLNGLDLEDGRASSTDDGWNVVENVTISDEEVTWKKDATCGDLASQKCKTGSKMVKQQGVVNRYTGQLTNYSSLGSALELVCEALHRKF